jgi:hypothetical protein
MADIKKTLSELQAIYADNTNGDISPNDLRDGFKTVVGSMNLHTTSANYTATADDIVIEVDTSAGDVTVTIPGANDSDGTGDTYNQKVFYIINTDSNNVLLSGTSFTVQPNKTLAIISNGTTWLELNKAGADVTTFLDLTDTTSAYTGAARSLVQVTSAEDGLEFTKGPQIDYIDFNTEAAVTSAITDIKGRVHWNDDDQALNVGTGEAGSPVLQVGQEQWLRVSNKTGTTLPNGCVVYVNGAQGQRPTVTSADNGIENNSSLTIGLLTEEILHNGIGFCNTFGLVRGVDTAGMTEGGALYLGTSGTYTETRPVSPAHEVRLGEVIFADATDGIIFTKVQNGFELYELHDVDNAVDNARTLDGYYIQSNSATGLWTSGHFDTDVSNNSDVSANTAKVSNVTTNLSVGTITTSSVDVNSSDGTNATLSAATSATAGVMTTQQVIDLSTVTNNRHVESTGLLHAGEGILSVGTGGPGVATTFSITDGSGQTESSGNVTTVSWSGLTDIVITNLASALISFISIDSGGSVIQRTTRWSPAQARAEIVLGVVVHVNKITVDTVNQEQSVATNATAQSGDILEGLGFVNLYGNKFSPFTTDLRLACTVGQVMNRGINFFNDGLDNPHKLTLAVLNPVGALQYRMQDGSSGPLTDTVVDPNIWDDGSVFGSAPAVPTNRFTVQRIFKFTSNNVKIQPGQAIYNSLAEAKASIQTEPFIVEPSIEANGFLRGYLCIREGTTDLTNANDAFFLDPGKFGGGFGTGGLSVSTMQNTYDNSSNPEISTDKGAVTYQNATSANSDVVFEVADNVSTVNYSVTGEGKVTATSAIYKSITLTSATSATETSAVDLLVKDKSSNEFQYMPITEATQNYARMNSLSSVTFPNATGNNSLQWNASAIENTDSNTYTPTTTGLQVLKSGLYELNTLISLIQASGTGQRVDPTVVFTINGTEIESRTYEMYIRHSGTSEESAAGYSIKKYLNKDCKCQCRLFYCYIRWCSNYT